jgi:hypothetical protein
MSDNKSPRLLTSAEQSRLLSAIEALHKVVGNEEFSKDGVSPLPAFKDCDTENLGYVLSRSLAALSAKEKNDTHALLSGVKGKIDVMLRDARVAKIGAWRKVQALIAGNPDVAAMLGSEATKAPESASITVKEALPCFQDGTSANDAVKMAVRMGFKVSAGKSDFDRRIVSPINVDALAAE